MALATETQVNSFSPGREFARRFTNTLVELQLQAGIHRRIENFLNDWSAEHPNLRASYVSREVDAAYFQSEEFPPEALSRPKLHGIAVGVCPQGDRRTFKIVAR